MHFFGPIQDSNSFCNNGLRRLEKGKAEEGAAEEEIQEELQQGGWMVEEGVVQDQDEDVVEEIMVEAMVRENNS